MGLYNMIFGENPHADKLLALLGLAQGDFYRFRDCYLTEDGKQIAVYTRAGGGNREDGEGSRLILQEHPLYVRDADDDFDCTYATFYFKIPSEADLKDIPMEPDRDAMWRVFLAGLEQK